MNVLRVGTDVTLERTLRMNCRLENFEALIVARMELWWTINNSTLTPWIGRRARKNYRRLIRTYPGIASAYGFTEESV
jgi:hypothetical protein